MAKIEYTFDPFEAAGIDPSEIPRGDRREAAEAAAAYVKEQILSYTAQGKTSVEGGLWKKKLTPEYKKEKAKESSVTYANMEESGQMLDALDVEAMSSKKIKILIDGDQADKAEGNLLGSYGRTPNPDNAREFMPYTDSMQLRSEILSGVRDILESYAEDSNGEEN